MKLIKLNPLILAAAVVLAGHANGATIIGNLSLANPTVETVTGPTSTRQYATSFVGTGDAVGATINLTFTLTMVGNGDLSIAFNDGGTIFREPAANNLGVDEGFTITIDSITVTNGWTINSGGKTDTVRVAINGGDKSEFSVNGGTAFEYTGTGTGVSQQNVTDSRFTAFDSAGDTLSFLNVNQTANGGQNIRNVAFSFDVSAIPEPSSALLGGLGLLVLLRRRR